MKLRPYQIEGVKFLAEHRHALLADEMRVGKSPQAICAAERVAADEILVVCPAIAVSHWEREFPKWWTGAIRPERPHVKVYSYDKAKIYATHLLGQRWDVTIVDECHYAKNPDAQRTKLVYGKGGLGWVSRRLWALSGTPAPKHAAELWPMLRSFGAVGMTYDEFVSRYCYCEPMSRRILGTRAKMIPELRCILEKVMLRRKRKDVAPEMPDIDYQFLEVAKPADARDFKPGAESSTEPPDKDDRIAVAMAKVMPLAENILFALDNELLRQTVVFGWHTEPLVALAHALQRRGIKTDLITGKTADGPRQRVQEQFRRGELQVVIANIAAAGTAIDLSAASHAYFLELDWVPGSNVQAANRLISMDKDEKVTVDVATWPGTIDEAVQKTLLRRTQELAKLY